MGPGLRRDDGVGVIDPAGDGRKLGRLGGFRFVVLWTRAGILAFGGFVALDQFDDGHRRVVAVAEAGLDDAGIAARAAGVALGERRQQLVGELGVLQAGDRLAAGMQPALLAERDQALDDRPQILRLRQRRADLLVLQQRGGEVLEHRLAVGRAAAEAAMVHPVAHGSVFRLVIDLLAGSSRPGGGCGANTARRSAWPAPRCSRAASWRSPCPNGAPYWPAPP